MLSSTEEKCIIVSGAGSITGFETISALENAGLGYSIIGTDLNPDVPAKFLVKLIKAPAISENGFEDFLIELLENQTTDFYLPTLVEEIIFLGKNRHDFPEKITSKLLVPSEEWVELMDSKLALAEFCTRNGIASPMIFKGDEDYAGKVIAKQSKFFQERAHRKEPRLAENLKAVANLDLGSGWYFSEYVKGEEFVVHGLSGFDRFSFEQCVFAKRIKLRNGHDAVIEVVAPEPKLLSIASEVMQLLTKKSVGPVDMQFIRNEEGDYYLIDLDFNFPSALPVFVASGYNSVKMLFNDLLNGVEPKFKIEPRRMYRHHAAFFEKTGQ